MNNFEYLIFLISQGKISVNAKKRRVNMFLKTVKIIPSAKFIFTERLIIKR